MPMSETVHKPTPNGGVKSTAYFMDEDHNPTEKSNAVGVEVIEYDAKDQEIHRTYLKMPGRKFPSDNTLDEESS